MAQSTKVYGKTTCTMAAESYITQVAISMRANSLTTWPKDLEYTDTLTVANTLVTGIRISNTDLAKRSGMMGVSMSAFTKMPQKRVKENIGGQMATDISVSGVTTC